MEIIPYSGDPNMQTAAYSEAYQFQIPWTLCQTGVHTGSIAPTYSPFAWEGGDLAFSSLKMNEGTGDLLLRWYNMRSHTVELKLSSNTPYYYFYKSTILEEHGERVDTDTSGRLALPVGPCEIVTIGISS